MKISSQITIEKILRYVFLLLCAGAGFMLLVNLGSYLGVTGEGLKIRGWVNYGTNPSTATQFPIAHGEIKIFDMGHSQHFAMVHFEHLSGLFGGLPLACLITMVLSDFAIVLVLYQLMQVFRSLDTGMVFRNDNTSRIRLIAYAMLSFSILTYLGSKLLSTYIQQVESGAAELKTVYPAVNGERVIFGVLIALIILALLKAFKLGNQLQQEQDLTI